MDREDTEGMGGVAVAEGLEHLTVHEVVLDDEAPVAMEVRVEMETTEVRVEVGLEVVYMLLLRP